MDIISLDPTSKEDKAAINVSPNALAARRPFHRATSEDNDPLYMPFTTSKRWTPAPTPSASTNQHDSGSASIEVTRRFNQKWTLQQIHALEDGVKM